jgi:uncharacterized glyoxalase superfamily protein PhnB
MRLRGTAPVFLVADVAATMRWYREQLGFEAHPFPEAPPHAFCILTKDDVEIMLQQLAGYVKPDLYEKRGGGVWNVYVRMAGVRELYDRVTKSADIQLVEPICRQEYGDTEFVIRDPNGYVLVFSEFEEL